MLHEAVDTRTAVWVSTAEKISKIVLGETRKFSQKFRGGGSQHQLCIKTRPLSLRLGDTAICDLELRFRATTGGQGRDLGNCVAKMLRFAFAFGRPLSLRFRC